MGLTREEQELALRVTGAAEVERLTALIKQEERTLVELNDAKKAGLITDAAYEAQLKRTAASLLDNRQALDELRRAADEQARAAREAAAEQARASRDAARAAREAAAEQARANAGVTGSTRAARQGFVDLSRAAQDFAQGGFPAIVNNLEGIGRGLPAILKNPLELLKSLPSIFTLVGVALLAVGPKLMDAARALGLFGKEADSVRGQVEKLAERIKELEEKPVKLAVDVVELQTARTQVEEIKAALKAIEQLGKTQAHYEKESGGAVAQVITESDEGGEEVKRRLRSQVVREQLDKSGPLAEARAAQEQAAKDVESLKGLKNAARSAEELESVNQQLVRAIDARNAAALRVSQLMTAITAQGGSADVELGKILEAAEKGTGARQAAAQKELARRLKQAGLGNLGESVEADSPAELKAQDDAEAAAEASIENQRAGAKARKQRADREKKKTNDLVDDLNKTGKEYEDLTEKDNKANGIDPKTGKPVKPKPNAGAARGAKDRTDDQVKNLTDHTSLDEQAAFLAAQMRATGGGSRRRQLDQLTAQVVKAITAANPQMRGLQAMNAGQRIAANAFKGVDAQVEAQRTELVGRGADATRATQVAVFDVLQTNGALLARVEGLEQSAFRLGQEAARQSQRARTVQRRGGGR